MRVAFICWFFMNMSLIILTSCKTHKKKDLESISQMAFKVEDSLLGLKYSDSINGFYMRMPKKYSIFELSDEQKNELIKLNIKSVYQARLKSNGSIFIVLNLNSLNDSLFVDYTNKLQLLTKSTKSNSIDSFYSNNLFIKQYIVKSDTAVQLKVIITNRFKGHYETDFYIPLSSYNLQSSTIESVLGSIN